MTYHARTFGICFLLVLFFNLLFYYAPVREEKSLLDLARVSRVALVMIIG